MSETEVSPAPPAPRSGGRRAPALSLLVAVVALVLAGYAAWQQYAFARERAAGEAERAQQLREQTRQLADIARSAELAREASAPLDRRIADLEAVNRSLREELLGLGERAKLMEDALARVADRRLSGAVMMRVNEAEYLLHLGEVRLRLFADAESTAAAFRLADAELAALDDPLFAGVRQTIAAEVAALAAAPMPDRNALAARIDDIAARLPTLVVHGAPLPRGEVAVPAEAGVLDRAAAVLSQYVRIREHDDGTPALLSPLQAEAARAALSVELALVKAALVAGDAPRARRALDRAQQLLATGFDDDAARRDVQQALAQVASADLDAPVPTVGQALEELRNLRATRVLADRERVDTPDDDGAQDPP